MQVSPRPSSAPRRKAPEANDFRGFCILMPPRILNCCLAYVGTTLVWECRSPFDLTLPREAWPKAWAAVQKALDLDRRLSQVQYVLAARGLFV